MKYSILLSLSSIDVFHAYNVTKRLGRTRWPRGQSAWNAIADAKQRWSVIEWVTKNVLSRAPPCFGRHVKPLLLHLHCNCNCLHLHQYALGPRKIHREDLCFSSGDINRLMMKETALTPEMGHDRRRWPHHLARLQSLSQVILVKSGCLGRISLERCLCYHFGDKA
jgi:hypothetical protein